MRPPVGAGGRSRSTSRYVDRLGLLYAENPLARCPRRTTSQIQAFRRGLPSAWKKAYLSAPTNGFCEKMSRDIKDSKAGGNWHMPARPRIPKPEEGALQAFAYDLRQLGAGQVSVGWIAGHHGTEVSRAALYAALSGRRLPTEMTVGTLLRWWAGKPDAERAADRNASDPAWGWIERLPDGDDARLLAEEWRRRYQLLSSRKLEVRPKLRKAPYVRIEVPPEQHAFIEQLKAVIRKTGLIEERWLLFDKQTLRIERYLAGVTIPTDGICDWIARRCVKFVSKGEHLDMVDAADRLRASAALARTARARDRRIARKTAASPRGTHSLPTGSAGP